MRNPECTYFVSGTCEQEETITDLRRECAEARNIISLFIDAVSRMPISHRSSHALRLAESYLQPSMAVSRR